jgi:hypothetical protein
LLATPARGLIANVAHGDVVAIPAIPLSNILYRVVEALFAISNIPFVPVPLPYTVSFDDGAVELPIATRG